MLNWVLRIPFWVARSVTVSGEFLNDNHSTWTFIRVLLPPQKTRDNSPVLVLMHLPYLHFDQNKPAFWMSGWRLTTSCCCGCCFCLCTRVSPFFCMPVCIYIHLYILYIHIHTCLYIYMYLCIWTMVVTNPSPQSPQQVSRKKNT